MVAEEGIRIGITGLSPSVAEIRACIRTLSDLAVGAVRDKDPFHRRVGAVLGTRPGLSARLTVYGLSGWSSSPHHALPSPGTLRT